MPVVRWSGDRSDRTMNGTNAKRIFARSPAKRQNEALSRRTAGGVVDLKVRAGPTGGGRRCPLACPAALEGAPAAAICHSDHASRPLRDYVSVTSVRRVNVGIALRWKALGAATLAVACVVAQGVR